MRLLLACADPAAARPLRAALEAQGWVVDGADTAEEALDFVHHYEHAAVLVADGLPDMAAHEAVRRLRAKGARTPAVVLSGSERPAEPGRDGVSPVVRAFSAGADDVVARGIDRDELVARLRAVTRRARGHAQNLLALGPVALDLDSREVHVHGRRVHLTGKEFAVLQLLVLRKGMVLTKDAILGQLYGGMDEPEAKIVDVFVCKLRRKLDQAGAPEVIGTVWGRGYVARDPAPAAEAPASPVSRPATPASAGAGRRDSRALLDPG